MEIAGRRVLVTGASSGIGRACALALVRAGAEVVATARRAHLLDTLTREHPGIRTIQGDLLDASFRQTLCRTVGLVDVLVNAAGVGAVGPLLDLPLSSYQRMLELNVVAPLDLVQRLAPAMLAAGGGRIINVGSVGSYIAAPPTTAYASTKFALRGLTDGMRRELREGGVAVVLVAPRRVRTEWFEVASGSGPLDDAAWPTGTSAPHEVAVAVMACVSAERPPWVRFVPAGAGLRAHLIGLGLGGQLPEPARRLAQSVLRVARL